MLRVTDADEALLALSGLTTWVREQIMRVTGLDSWSGLSQETAMVIHKITRMHDDPNACTWSAHSKIRYMATRQSKTGRLPIVLAVLHPDQRVTLAYGRSRRTRAMATVVSPGSAWRELSPWRPDWKKHLDALWVWANKHAQDRCTMTRDTAIALARSVWPELWDE